MGVSTDAILFWGYAFDAEDVKPWDLDRDVPPEDHEDDDDRFLRVSGRAPAEPTIAYHRDNPEWQAYYDARRAIIEGARGQLVRHCSDGCTMYGVAHRASVQTAYRGDAKAAHCDTGEAWRAELDAYCALMGINTAGMEPRWLLVSWWG